MGTVPNILVHPDDSIPANETFDYFLIESGDTENNLRIGHYADGAFSELEANDELEFPLGLNGPAGWFIDLAAVGPVNADLTVEARDNDGNLAGQDRVHVHTFSSVIVILGGQFQPVVPGETQLQSDSSNAGMFWLGRRLYNQGSNVYVMGQDAVVGWGDPFDFGDGDAYNLLERCVDLNDIRQIAVSGYSHGGGGTLDLLNRLDAHRNAISGEFTIVVAGYVDAIKQSGGAAVEAAPSGAQAMVNLYQQNTGGTELWLGGSPISFPSATADNFVQIFVTEKTWGTELIHSTIDDHILVQETIRKETNRRVPNP